MIIFFRIILQHHCELSPLEIDVPSENPFYDLLHISLVTSCKKRVNLFCRPGLIHWIISDFREETGTFLFTKGNNSCALELHNTNSRTNLFTHIQLTVQNFHQHNRENLTQLQFK